MRLCVIDQGVVVEVLGAGADEEAVQRASGALCVEPDVQVVAGQSAAERDRMRGEATVASLGHLGGRDVEGRIALALELGEVEDRAVAQDDFGNGVGEVQRPGHPDVRLHDVGLAARLRDHEVAGMGDRGAEDRLRQKDEVNRVRDGRSSRDPDERAVFEERRAAAKALPSPRALREMRLRGLRVLGQNVLQAGHFEARPASRTRSAAGIPAVDEDG